MDFELEGLERFLNKLEGLGKDVDGALKAGIDKTARRVKRDAKLLVPVAEIYGGKLRGSIAYEVTQDGDRIEGLVFSPLDYAPYVEYGTGQLGAESPIENPPEGLAYKTNWAGMKAQPYLYPALKRNQDKAEKDVAAELIKLIGGK